MNESVIQEAQMRNLRVVYSISDNLSEALKYEEIRFVLNKYGHKIRGCNSDKTIFVVSEYYEDSIREFEETVRKLEYIGINIKSYRQNLVIRINHA